MEPHERSEIISRLQTEIVRLERACPSHNSILDIGLGPLKDSFPEGSFPLGAVHEFMTCKKEDSAATIGFISGLLSSIMGSHGVTLWISSSRELFPPALKMLGTSPDRFIFLNLKKEKDIIWAMEEALKCSALAAVIGEMRDITFTESRRLQLAVEQSKVTGFIVRHTPQNPSQRPATSACVSRWRITSVTSDTIDELPGIGFPKWKVELLRMRNGRNGQWNIEWRGNAFAFEEHRVDITAERKKAG